MAFLGYYHIVNPFFGRQVETGIQSVKIKDIVMRPGAFRRAGAHIIVLAHPVLALDSPDWHAIYGYDLS